MRQIARKVILLVVVITLPTCTVDDEDRCPSGYAYNREFRYCAVIGDTDSENSSDSEITDAGTADTDVLGMGDPCETSDDCVGTADYCQTRSGYCTTTGCGPGQCPADYTCCDCTEVEGYGSSACLTEADAALAPIIGCICE